MVHPLQASCILPSECTKGIGLAAIDYRCVCKETQEPPVHDDETGQYLCGSTPVTPKPENVTCDENYYLDDYLCVKCPEH